MSERMGPLEATAVAGADASLVFFLPLGRVF